MRISPASVFPSDSPHGPVKTFRPPGVLLSTLGAVTAAVYTRLVADRARPTKPIRRCNAESSVSPRFLEEVH